MTSVFVILTLAILILFLGFTRPALAVVTFLFVAANPFLVSDRFSLFLEITEDSLELRDVLGLCLLLVSVIVILWRKAIWRGNRTLWLGAIGFVFVVVMAIPISVLRGNPLMGVLRQGLTWALYPALPIVTLQILRSREDWRTVYRASIVIGLLCAILTLLQVALGPEPQLLGTYTLKAFHGSVRVYPESITLQIFIFALLVSSFFSPGKSRIRGGRSLNLIAIFVIGMGILSTVSRTMILVSLLVLPLVIILHQGKRRLSSLILKGGVFVLISGAAFALSMIAELSTLNAVRFWFEKLVVGEMAALPSFSTRMLQYKLASGVVMEYPLFGVGLGVNTVHDYRLVEFISSGTELVHNAYLQVAMQLGMVGFLVFLIWAFGGLRASYQLRKISNKADRDIGTGVFVGLVVFYLANLVVAWGLGASSLAQLAIMIGLANGVLSLPVRRALARTAVSSGGEMGFSLMAGNLDGHPFV